MLFRWDYMFRCLIKITERFHFCKSPRICHFVKNIFIPLPPQKTSNSALAIKIQNVFYRTSAKRYMIAAGNILSMKTAFFVVNEMETLKWDVGPDYHKYH